MLRRPKPSDNEEDILKQQEEFSKGISRHSSVQIINKRKPDSDLPGSSFLIFSLKKFNDTKWFFVTLISHPIETKD